MISEIIKGWDGSNEFDLINQIADSMINEGNPREIELSRIVRYVGLHKYRPNSEFAFARLRNYMKREYGKLEVDFRIRPFFQILFYDANPIDGDQIDYGSERQNIQLALQNYGLENSWQIIPVPQITKDDFRKYISQYNPEILHIATHGSRNGILCVDKDDLGVILSPNEISKYLQFYGTVALVYLNVCSSKSTAEKIKELNQDTLIIYSNEEIPQELASNFSKEFYQLLFERPIDAADRVQIPQITEEKIRFSFSEVKAKLTTDIIHII